MNSSEALNKAQKQAAEHGQGPLLVIAGAGTGKTRVVVERIKRLLDKGVDSKHVLALTFTEKAAGEMFDRLAEGSQTISLDTTIATFNGFGDQLIKMYGSEIGLGNLRLLGATGQLVFLREHLDQLGLDYFAPVSRPDGQLDTIASYISKLKQQVIDPADYLGYAKSLKVHNEADKLEKQKHEELARVYVSYIDLCRKEQVIDYDDQLFLAIDLLRKRPNIREKLRKTYAYILVDEFQDTNPLQSTLLDLLVDKKQNLMVVGDDDQSIYGWRGATLANILEFTTRYPAAKTIALIENYRSTQAILDSAYRLIQHNNPDRLEVMTKIHKQLHANQPDHGAPQVMHFSSLNQELSWIAEDISQRIRTGQDPSTIAVLARRNVTVKRMHEQLEYYNVSHAVSGLSDNMYDAPAVKQLLEALHAIHDPLDNVALFHTLTGPLFGISNQELSPISARAKQEHEPLVYAIKKSDSSQAKKALAHIEAWRESSVNSSVGTIAYAVITETGWKDVLYAGAEADTFIAHQVQALSQLFYTLREFERISRIASLQNYMINLPVLQTAGDEVRDASLDISDELVNVMSVHRAKGLEWKTVYIADCTEGSFPMHNFGSSLKVPQELSVHTEADDRMAEERRLMYVAATRAREELILTYADSHTANTKRRPSRFLSELFGNEYLKNGEQQAPEATTLETFAPTTPDQKTISLPQTMTEGSLLVLSASQVTDWLRCPQDFYYLHVLQMPLPETPHQQYGTLIHRLIQRIHEGRKDKALVPLEKLIEDTTPLLPTRGYETAGTRERAHIQAQKTIKQLYERFTVQDMPTEVETPFRVEVPGAGLILTGRIDAVYELSDGGIEIRDYKTGTSVTSPEKAKSRATNSDQLTLYALAWRIMHGGMPALLTLDFVETGHLGSVKKQAKTIDNLEHKLVDMVAKIKAGDYSSHGKHDYCKHPLVHSVMNNPGIH